MKSRILLVLAFGISFTPAALAGSARLAQYEMEMSVKKPGQLGLNATPQGSVNCRFANVDKGQMKNFGSSSVEAPSSSSAGSAAGK